MKELIEAALRAEEFRLHPLGFFYLQDFTGEDATRRIHVWICGGLSPAENECHQHSFDIESIMIAGRMRSDIFGFAEDSGGPLTEYMVAYEGSASKLSPSGRRGQLFPIVSFETFAGMSYRLEAGAIHRVTVIERPCITMLTTMERHIPIFSYGKHEEAAFDRRRCTEDEAVKIRMNLMQATINK